MNGFRDIIHVPWKVTSRRHRQPQQLDAPSGLARRQRRFLGHTNSRYVIDEGRQCFRRKAFRRHLRQKTFDVNENSVASRRSDKRNPIFKPAPEIVHLFNAARDMGIVCEDLLDSRAHGFHSRAWRLAFACAVVDQTICFGHGPIEILEGPEPFEFSSLQDPDAIGEKLRFFEIMSC